MINQLISNRTKYMREESNIPLFNKNLNRKDVTLLIKQLVQYVNANNGTNNCVRVALRVMEILRDGKQNTSPVSKQPLTGEFNPEVRNGRIVTTSIFVKDLLEMQNNESKQQDYGKDFYNIDCPEEYIDLTEENKIILEKIRFKKACREDFIEILQSLPKDRYNRSFGLMLYTHPPKQIGGNFILGHIANFYVDANNQVYFIDAQNHQDPESWVTTEPANDGYIPDVFYLECPLKPNEILNIIKVESLEVRSSDLAETTCSIKPEVETTKQNSIVQLSTLNISPAKRIRDSKDKYTSSIAKKPKIITKTLQSEFIDAAYKNNIEAIKTFIQQGIDINTLDESKQNALMIAAYYGYHELVATLLLVGNIDINACQNVGYTALMLAAQGPHTEIMQMLLSIPYIDISLSSIPMKQYENKQYNALDLYYIECEKNNILPNVNIIDLFDKAAMMRMAFTSSQKPGSKKLSLINAVKCGNPDLFRAILQSPVPIDMVDVNEKTASGDTALLMAIKIADYSRLCIFEALLSFPNIDLTIRDSDGKTAIDLLCAIPQYKGANVGYHRKLRELQSKEYLQPKKESSQRKKTPKHNSILYKLEQLNSSQYGYVSNSWTPLASSRSLGTEYAIKDRSFEHEQQASKTFIPTSLRHVPYSL